MVNIKTGAQMPGLSFFGSIYQMLVVIPKIGGAATLMRLNKKYGYIHSSSVFGHTITVGDPLLVKEVLKKIEDFTKQAPRPDILKDAIKIMGTRSIISVNQPEWHTQRSLLNKAFTSNKIFFDPMQKKTNQCVLKWKDGKPAYNVGNDLQKMTLDVLAMCIFGCDFDTLNDKHTGPLEAYNYCFKNMFNPLRFLIPYWTELPIPLNRKIKQKATEFDDYCWSIIADAKKNLSIQNNAQPTTEDGTKQSTSLIDLMINSGMDDSDIRDNLSIFFLAGHETTASTLAWSMGVLASYPELQQRAREEVLKKAPDGLTYESIKDLDYIDWIIHETMRMYPASPLNGGRELHKEYILGDWKIPEKTFIQIDLMSMLHDPRIWGDPEVFRPERWSHENLTKEQRTVWMPFSYGPRICIGMNFSLLEQKIFLATILREFSQIELSKDSEVVPNTKSLLYTPNFEKLKIKFVV